MNENASFDPEQFKANTRDAWNKAARGWDEHTPQIRQWLTTATHLMFDLADIKPGYRVLDVAAGAGDQTLGAARRVGASGSVLATDISEPILDLARANAQKAGLDNIDIKVADAENLGLRAAQFDAAICRLGLMFCPNAGKALREMHHALKPGSRACAMVFSEPEKNPCIGIVLQTAFTYAGLPPPSPYRPGGLFSLGRPGHLDELFASAGFENVSSRVLSAVFNLPSATSYLEFIRSSASPVMQILSSLGDTDKASAWEEMKQKLEVFQTEDGWRGPNELVLTVGTMRDAPAARPHE
jgi:ubiquinone/menaquinone biosynthesis C-methylase UbiE